MPSPVGHALGAIAIGWAVARPAPAGRALAVQAGLLACLGAAPDLDLLIGRHSRETHSIGAALIVASVAAWWRWPVASSSTRIWLAAFLAWLSHPLLDALSPDSSVPIGVMLFWPFSTTHWQTGLELFVPIWRNWHDPRFLGHNLGAVAWELLLLGPLATLTWWTRRQRSLH